jgi:hypothetical protein
MIRIVKESIKTYQVVADGIIVSDLTTGYMLSCPVVIINAEDDKNIIDLINIHKTIELGDTMLTWGRNLFKWDSFILKLNFTNPMNLIFGINFSLKKDHMLIDGIMHTRHFYLQVGKVGDKVSKKIHEGKILVALPDLGVDDMWKKLLAKVMKRQLKSKGFRNDQIQMIMNESVKEFRKIWDIKKNDT